MSLEFYRWLHILGLTCLLLGFGLLIAYFAMGDSTRAKTIRKSGFIAHGLGLFFIILSGFGLLARYGILSDLPIWAWMKFAVWIFLGSAVAVIKRKPEWNFLMIFVVIGLVLSAAYLGIFKPGWTPTPLP